MRIQTASIHLKSLARAILHHTPHKRVSSCCRSCCCCRVAIRPIYTRNFNPITPPRRPPTPPLAPRAHDARGDAGGEGGGDDVKAACGG
jgi:hypothetical protein